MITPEIASFLHCRTGKIKHTGRTFYDHLIGTHDLLVQYGAPDRVCLAGLFHSIYGTNVFRVQAMSLAERDAVREVIGEPAERLAYIFCACNRPTVLIEEAAHKPPYKVKDRYNNGEMILLSSNDLADLLTIEIANLIEQKAFQIVPQVRTALRRVKYPT